MRDTSIHIRINRSACIAMLVSLLVHVLALFLLSRQEQFKEQQLVVPPPHTISVRLSPRPVPKEPAAAIVPKDVIPPPPVPPTPVARKSTVQPSPVLRVESPAVIATPETEPPVSLPPATAKPTTPLDPSQFPDMLSYVKAARERRGVAGEDPGQNSEEVDAQALERLEDEARIANIKRNLQQPGTNGIFQISRMDAFTATFSFRGWKNELSYSRREVYQVEVEMGGDIQRAVVRKMIEIIRRYYNGDFNWDSLRLGRVVVLSARLQDNDGLEDFLMREFFAGQGIPAR